jgi:hypothetical protein
MKLSLILSYILVPTVSYYRSLLYKASVFRVSESYSETSDRTPWVGYLHITMILSTQDKTNTE